MADILFQQCSCAPPEGRRRYDLELDAEARTGFLDMGGKGRYRVAATTEARAEGLESRSAKQFRRSTVLSAKPAARYEALHFCKSPRTVPWIGVV